MANSECSQGRLFVRRALLGYLLAGSTCFSSGEQLALSAKPENAAQSPLQACPLDQFRQFRCANPKSDSQGCAQNALDVDYVFSPRAWEPAPKHETPDLQLQRAYRHPPASGICCYSSCEKVEVHSQAVSAHSYRSIECIAEMKTTHPAAGNPRCPAAIKFPGDWMSHIAAFDAQATRARTKKYASDPDLPGIKWCCYGRAPAGAIGPL